MNLNQSELLKPLNQNQTNTHYHPFDRAILKNNLIFIYPFFYSSYSFEKKKVLWSIIFMNNDCSQRQLKLGMGEGRAAPISLFEAQPEGLKATRSRREVIQQNNVGFLRDLS